MKITVPKSYSVGGQEVNVRYVNNYEHLGSVELFSGDLIIAETYQGNIQSETSKENTFVHELVHSILDTMGEYDLSQNEKFVCCFAGFLLEALKSAK